MDLDLVFFLFLSLNYRSLGEAPDCSCQELAVDASLSSAGPRHSHAPPASADGISPWEPFGGAVGLKRGDIPTVNSSRH